MVRFDITGDKHCYWMLLQRPEPEICIKHPGHDENLIVTTDAVTLTNVQSGRLEFAQALKRGQLSLSGPPYLAKAFPTWGGLSYFANVKPARQPSPATHERPGATQARNRA